MTTSKVLHVIFSSDDSDSECEILPLYERITSQKLIYKHSSKESNISRPIVCMNIDPAKRNAVESATSSDADVVSPAQKANYTQIQDIFTQSHARLSPPFRHEQNDKGEDNVEMNGWGEDLPDLEAMNEFDRTWDMHTGDILASRQPVKTNLSRARKEDVDKIAAVGNESKGRSQKQVEKESDKLLKQMRREILSTSRPVECVKSMEVCLDAATLTLQEATNVCTLLREAEITCRRVEQALPHTVTWIRREPRVFLDNLRMINTVVDQIEEKDVVVVIPTAQFVSAVYSFKRKQNGICGERTLVDTVLELERVLPEKRLTLMACGLELYFRNGRKKKQTEYRANVLGVERGSNKTGKKRKEDDRYFGLVSRVDVEEALVDLQINYPHCNVRLVENSLDMAEIIISFTRAMAKASSQNCKGGEVGGGRTKLALFAQSDWRQAVKVDKSGKGLLWLWQRQVEQFHMVATDAALAIVAEYPSPRALLKAYKRCGSEKECQMLLKDIDVRRGVGPLARSRKMGPEMSRKIYLLLTATDGNLVLEHK